MADCKHQHGGYVTYWGLWVCGQCYHKLSERPKKYGPPQPFVPAIPRKDKTKPLKGPLTVPPQEIIWMAEIKLSDEGTILPEFIRTIAKQLMHKAELAENDAYDMALELLRNFGEEFADKAFDWSHDGAREIVKEEMSYWDEGGEAKGNG